MKKSKFRTIAFVVIAAIGTGFGFDLNSCPENYELEQATYFPTSRGLVLHCDFAGLETCCKRRTPEEFKEGS